MKFKEYKLSDLIELKSQGVNTTTDKISYSDTGIRIIQAKNINKFKYSYDEKNYIDEETFNKMKENHKLHSGEVLYTNIGSQLGNAVVYESNERAIITWNVMKLIPKERLLDNYYLCYWLNNNSDYIRNLNSSSTMPFVSGEILLNIKIKIPELEIQKRISKIIRNITNKIKENIYTNNNLQELINSIFKRWFVDFEFPNVEGKSYKSSNGKMIDSEFGEIPEEWKVIIFKDIIDFSNGYSIDSKRMLDKEENNTYKVFKMGNIKPWGGINKDKTKSWLSKEYCNGLEKYISKKGDILMCMTDMKNSDTPLLGHTALIDKDNEFIINQRVGIIRCKKELVNYPFVYTLTNLDFFVKNIRSRANSGVQVNLSTKGICDTSLILPDRKTLDKFNNIAEPMYEQIFRNNEENETLTQLRDTLLPKLMNGEIDLDNIEI